MPKVDVVVPEKKMDGATNNVTEADKLTKKGRQRRNRRARMLAVNDRCFYCNKRLTLDSSTIDHRIPKSKGGSNNDDNLVLSCLKCNNEKADREW